MTICFELTMPGRGSWNGRWSQEKDRHIIIRNLGPAKGRELTEKGTYRYRWADGWEAMITCTAVTSREAAKLRKASRGFCGYDWMVDSIIRYGMITPKDVRKPLVKEKEERKNEAG